MYKFNNGLLEWTLDENTFLKVNLIINVIYLE